VEKRRKKKIFFWATHPFGGVKKKTGKREKGGAPFAPGLSRLDPKPVEREGYKPPTKKSRSPASVPPEFDEVFSHTQRRLLSRAFSSSIHRIKAGRRVAREHGGSLFHRTLDVNSSRDREDLATSRFRKAC